MAFRFFTVPIQNSAQAEAELNAFLGSHKVLAVDRRWVDQGPASFWTFCIDYLDGAPAAARSEGGRLVGKGPKVDYKEVLKPDEFAVFSRLRDLRKDIAQAEGVPVYTIFTNDQLAQMVQARATTKAALEKIAGVGDARIEKYGGRVLDLLSQAWRASDEASGPAVRADPGA
jgi:superfamily II DNA helicase RecQ